MFAIKILSRRMKSSFSYAMELTKAIAPTLIRKVTRRRKRHHLSTASIQLSLCLWRHFALTPPT